jgi:hypothetical protein
VEETFPVLTNLRTRCVRGVGHNRELSLQKGLGENYYKVCVEKWGNYVEK